MSALIIAEHDNHHLMPATLATIDAAKYLTNDITLIIIGYDCKLLLKTASMINYITKVIYIDHYTYKHNIAENITNIVTKIFNNHHQKYKYILIGATAFGKNILPRIAACLHFEQISEITKIINHNTFQRWIYAGNAIQTVQSLAATVCLSIRAINFNDKLTQNTKIACIEKIEHNEFKLDQRITFINKSTNNVIRPNLTTAKIVVAGGAGLKSKENFLLIEQLAQVLNAAVGASKAAVDAGFAPNNWQIGQTGKIIAPKLYIAVGISGAIQHITGIKESKIIVAINQDENAPIFKLAHYAMIGDLFEIVPALIKKLSTKKSNAVKNLIDA